MKKIIDLFDIQNARSRGFDSHQKGIIPFVSNGLYNNGIVGYITSLEDEKVFTDKAICVSSFCEATVHNPPFLPRGNGGSGLIVLIPKSKMTDNELYYYATQINNQRWRFSFSRMVIGNRLKNLSLLDDPINTSVRSEIVKLLPKGNANSQIRQHNNYKWVLLTDLCNIEKKSALPQNQLETNGKTPYVTTSSKNNGISDYVFANPNSKGKCLTVALNGSVGETFFQFDDFITSGDNITLRLKTSYDPYMLFFIAFLIRRQRWRYNYYRKLTLKKLNKFKIPLPFSDKNIDTSYIRKVVGNNYGFSTIKKYI